MYLYLLYIMVSHVQYGRFSRASKLQFCFSILLFQVSAFAPNLGGKKACCRWIHGSAGKDMKNCVYAPFNKLLHRDLIGASQFFA
jgi:hypothetical protein